jgi:hypothetical protein
MDFEFIDENEIEGVKRGRKTTVPTELVEAIRSMPKGKAVKVKDYKLDPTSEDYRNEKANVSSTIRKAGELAGVKVSITWTLDGVPQVKASLAKAKRK